MADAIYIDTEKIVPVIKNDPIFIPILAKISIPFNVQEKTEQETNLQDKEIKAKKHLEDMFEITRNLSYNDIKMLKKEYKIKNIENNQKEDIQKEL